MTDNEALIVQKDNELIAKAMSMISELTEAYQNSEKELEEYKKALEVAAPKAAEWDKFLNTGNSFPLRNIGGLFEYEIKVNGKFKRVSNRDIYRALRNSGDISGYAPLQKGKDHGLVLSVMTKETPYGTKKIEYVQALPKAVSYIDKLLRKTYEVKDVKPTQQEETAVAEQVPELEFEYQ